MWLDGSSQYLTRTPSAGNRTKWTLAWWFKLNHVATEMYFFSANDGTNEFKIGMDANSSSSMTVVDDSASLNVNTVPLQRDAEWYHCIVSLDTAQTNETDRILIYINGEKQELATGSAAYPSASGSTYWNNNQANEIGRRSRTTSSYLDGYMAQVVFLNADSIQSGDVSVSDFLDTWAFGDNGTKYVPKKTSDLTTLATNAGGNSFCLDFSDSSAFGNDTSSNNNDFSDAGSPTAANQSSDTPSLAYPKIHEIGVPGYHNSANYAMSKGSNRMTYSGSNQVSKGLISTQVIKPTDPKIYWEFYIEGGSVGGASGGRIGAGLTSADADHDGGFYATTGDIAYFYRGGVYETGGNTPNVSGWTTAAVGGYQNYAYEPSTGKMWVGVNGTWRNGSAADSTTLDPSNHDLTLTIKEYAFVMGLNRSSDIGVMNFGDNPSFSGNVTAGTESDGTGGLFKYAVPSGFVAPHSKNLSGPDYQGVDYFNTEIYEARGGGMRVGDFVPLSEAYTVSNSLIFNAADSAYLSKTPSGSGNRRTWTFSAWVKRDAIGGGPSSGDGVHLLGVDRGSGFGDRISFGNGDTDDRFNVQFNDTGAGRLQTKQYFRDNTQWVNFVIGVDTTQATAANRVKIYVNGVLLTASDLDTASYPAQDYDTMMNHTAAHHVGGRGGSASQFMDGYMAEVVMIDGTQLDASSFGQTDTSTNRWIPKDVSGLTFGTNGFYLDMAIAPGTGNGPGNDVSGNNNDYTVNAFGAADQSDDTPTNNKATVNGFRSDATVSEGSLKMVATGNAYQWGMSTLPIPKSGKWVFEAQSSNIDGSSKYGYFGICQQGGAAGSTNSGTNYQYGINLGNGEIVKNNSVIRDVGAGPTTSVMRCEYDADIDQMKIYDDNSLIHTAYLQFDIHSDLHFFAAPYGSGTDFTVRFDGFTHTPTTGFKALTTDNLDGADDKITAFAWIKNRDSTDNHMLFDRIRGVGNDIHANDSPAQVFNANTLQRFLQRGVEIEGDAEVNSVTEGYVLFQWLLGTSASTGSTTSPAGTIASTSLVAAADHFSIVQYEGTKSNGTVGHGLSAAPEMIMIKDIDANESWIVGHDAIGWTKNVYLNLSNGVATSATIWQDTAPTSSVFSIGTSDGVNKTETHIAYCFRSVPGVCKVGSYRGSNDANGPYVNLGFEPAWIMIKRTSGTENWFIFNNKSDTENPAGHYLLADGNTTENDHSGGNDVDFLANGFKVRSTNTGTNGASDTYIYVAMAEVGGNDSYPPIYGR